MSASSSSAWRSWCAPSTPSQGTTPSPGQHAWPTPTCHPRRMQMWTSSCPSPCSCGCTSLLVLCCCTASSSQMPRPAASVHSTRLTLTHVLWWRLLWPFVLALCYWSSPSRCGSSLHGLWELARGAWISFSCYAALISMKHWYVTKIDNEHAS